MGVRIFRYPEPREKTMAPRAVSLLEVTATGEEHELEVLEVDFRSPRLRDLLQSQIDQGHRYFVLDLIHEKHIDSNDLAQILDAWQLANASTGELVVAHPNLKIQELLRITKLDQVIKFFDSVPLAVDHFEGEH